MELDHLAHDLGIDSEVLVDEHVPEDPDLNAMEL